MSQGRIRPQMRQPLHAILLDPVFTLGVATSELIQITGQPS